MIIHASKDFEKRLKCEVGMKGHVVLQPGRLDAWSGHFCKIGRKSYVMLMNDATLYAIIIPAKGLQSLSSLLKTFIPLVANLWESHGASFDRENQSVIVLPRTNRALIGAMTDAIRIFRHVHEDNLNSDTETDIQKVETCLNGIPYKALKHEQPSRLLGRLLNRHS
jgi:hypothetical protein